MIDESEELNEILVDEPINEVTKVPMADPSGLTLPLSNPNTESNSVKSAKDFPDLAKEGENVTKDESESNEKGVKIETVSSPSCLMIKKAFVDDSPPPELVIGSPLNEGSVEVIKNC